MVLGMDDNVDPYEEAMVEDDSDNSDADDSDAESNYEDKSFDLHKSNKHRVRNPDDTFCSPFCPTRRAGVQEQGPPLACPDGIGVSNKHRHHSRKCGGYVISPVDQRRQSVLKHMFATTSPLYVSQLYCVQASNGIKKPYHVSQLYCSA